jgi:REP element-mobilizing transposase RayT
MGLKNLVAKKSKQQEFIGDGFEKPNACFGGSLLKSNPKTKRPLESKLPIHLVLRAIQGGMRLPKAFNAVNELFRSVARKHGVTVYKYANMGNHIHSAIKLSSIHRWAAFIRELSGGIAQLLKDLGIAPQGVNFWKHRPWTRIVQGWQKAFRIVCEYIYLNILEAEGHISRKETKTLKDLHAIWAWAYG